MLQSKDDKSYFGFLRVAAASPPLKIGDIGYNVRIILEFAKRAEKEGASIVLFPEMSITGYTIGDLFHQRLLLKRAKDGLQEIVRRSKKLKAVLIVGLPIAHEGKIFNTAAVVSAGRILGFVPKTHIPGYKEFYEERWFASSRDLFSKDTDFFGKRIPFGADLLFRLSGLSQAVFAVEICEDLWVPVPPSSRASLRGATLIFNPSASPELVGKADYRRELVLQQSARTISAYVYASSGVHESTTDLVFGGHSIVAENGSLLAESKRFQRNGGLIFADIDIEHLLHDREKTTSFAEKTSEEEKDSFDFRFLEVFVADGGTPGFFRRISPFPFVPEDPMLRGKRSEEIFSIQIAGLAKRLEQTRIKDVVIGVSGGLDSTLALLVSVKTFSLLKYPLRNIHAYTMPGFATSRRTKSNAYRLCKAFGIGVEEIDIAKGVLAHFKDIQHSPQKQDLVFENAQARYRTMVLMNKANQFHAIVVGTGDLSELALGWSTFSGDHLSHYNVNAGVPKTLVRYLVQWVLDTHVEGNARKALKDILETPISPELVRGKKGGITHKTEEIIGPYVLHDFFLYHFLRWGSSPKKILFLAERAFSKKYAPREIKKWLRLFLERFFKNQWKRSVMPDGPKVGSVALSPRGDWRMPSDAEAKMWLDELSD
ncbi:MAG: NAD(+) synthase [Candidatus Sungbacteria bacterium]|nr:NAD(+) synthase [Candidatus Sungbacteria bacterium]